MNGAGGNEAKCARQMGQRRKKRTLGKAFCPLPSFFGPTPPFLPIDCRPILSARRPSHFFARLFHQPIQKPFLLPPISPFSSHLLNLKSSRYGQSAGRKKVSEGRRKDDWTINNPPLFTLMLNANAVDSSHIPFLSFNLFHPNSDQWPHPLPLYLCTSFCPMKVTIIWSAGRSSKFFPPTFWCSPHSLPFPTFLSPKQKISL